jgi:hypothetical protein
MRARTVTITNLELADNERSRLTRSILLWLNEQKDWEKIEAPQEKNTKNSLSILFPRTYTFYNTFYGWDFFLFVMVSSDDISVTASVIETLEDVPCNLTDGFDDIPPEIYDRLERNTRDIKAILKELRELKRVKYDRKKEKQEETREYNKLVQILLSREEAYKAQKRRIKSLLEQTGVKITPGSPLSRLLRLDNLPR